MVDGGCPSAMPARLQARQVSRACLAGCCSAAYLLQYLGTSGDLQTYLVEGTMCELEVPYCNTALPSLPCRLSAVPGGQRRDASPSVLVQIKLQPHGDLPASFPASTMSRHPLHLT